MNRAHHPRRPLTGGLPIAALALALLPDAASAAGGGLELIPDWRLLLTLLIFFALLIVPVDRAVFQPLLRVLDAREERTSGTRARAEKLERDAAEVLARYESSVRATREESEGERRGLLEQVRAEAQRETAAAREEAERRIEAARAELGSALEGARETLRGEARDLARQAATQVLGRAL